MILYNMRYRGSLEYDKVVLNSLQIYNHIQELKQELLVDDDMLELKLLKDKVDQQCIKANKMSIAAHKIILKYKR